jgi:hypothetical protein
MQECCCLSEVLMVLSMTSLEPGFQCRDVRHPRPARLVLNECMAAWAMTNVTMLNLMLLLL